MSSSPVKFLVVDDLEANLIALEGLLRREGLELLKASSARSALELLLVHDVALAIIDVQMPELDGFQLAELMRGAERTRRVPIIFVTAGGTDSRRHFRGYELGAVDFLLKPIDPHVLRSKADVFFELARQRDELREAQLKVREYAEGLERTVAERTAKLTEMVQELEAFSYTIAHDMRSPLRSMVGYAEILCDEHAAAIDPEAGEYLRRIRTSALRLDRLIQDVLRYSRIVRQELPLQPVPLRELVEEVIEGYPNLAAVREHVNVAPDLPTVSANKAALTQVLSNLLDNAVKFVVPGRAPVVRISAEPAEPPADAVPSEHGWVRIRIEDEGIGIEPAARDRLFQMFQRLNRPGDYEGTGIGLAIVRKAIDRMGGDVGVESAPGRGTCFWFILRRAGP